MALPLFLSSVQRMGLAGAVGGEDRGGASVTSVVPKLTVVCEVGVRLRLPGVVAVPGSVGVGGEGLAIGSYVEGSS